MLPIAFGAATKTVPYVMDGTKLYHFTLRIGEARDTDDADGAVTATSLLRPGNDAFEAALPAFRGDIMQIPPAYSAIKVAGERAYDMAREGRAPLLEPRPARVDRFDLIDRPDEQTAVFAVQSGKGVYMRSLARDPRRRLRHGGPRGSAAPVAGRAVSGASTRFRWTNAKRGTIPRQLPRTCCFRSRPRLADIPALALTEAEAFFLSRGQAISLVDLMGRIPRTADPDGGLARAMAGTRVIGLCRLSDGMLRPERLL